MMFARGPFSFLSFGILLGGGGGVVLFLFLFTLLVWSVEQTRPSVGKELRE